jgi:hypothetical protein
MTGNLLPMCKARYFWFFLQILHHDGSATSFNEEAIRK